MCTWKNCTGYLVALLELVTLSWSLETCVVTFLIDEQTKSRQVRHTSHEVLSDIVGFRLGPSILKTGLFWTRCSGWLLQKHVLICIF